MWLKRKELYEIYQEKLKNLPLNFQKKPKYKIKHAYHLFIIILDKNKTKKTREELIRFLKKNKIGFGIHYRSISDLSFYKKTYKLNSKDFPESSNVGTNSITLPLYPDLKYSEINKICSCLRSFFKD
jgi:UDP-4-amino-4-deoxy-L-arabinose-oxoglutarate aminotransferase